MYQARDLIRHLWYNTLPDRPVSCNHCLSCLSRLEGYGWRLGSGLSFASLDGWWVLWGPWSSLFVRFCDLQSVHKNIYSGFECHSPGRHHCLSSFRDIVLRPLSWSSIFTDFKLKHRDTTQCRRPHSSEVEHTGREIYPWWYSVFLTWKFWHTRLRSKWYKHFKLNMFGGVRVFDSDASGSSPGYGHNPNPWDHDYHQKWHVPIFTARSWPGETLGLHILNPLPSAVCCKNENLVK